MSLRSPSQTKDADQSDSQLRLLQNRVQTREALPQRHKGQQQNAKPKSNSRSGGKAPQQQFGPQGQDPQSARKHPQSSSRQPRDNDQPSDQKQPRDYDQPRGPKQAASPEAGRLAQHSQKGLKTGAAPKL